MPLRCHLAHARVGNDELRGGRRCRRADVRDEIAQRHVGLVTDSGHCRPREARHRAHERLVVERREILGRTAAARDDHNIEVAHLRETVERADERLDRAAALHERGREHELNSWVTPCHDGLDVVPHRADLAGDDADASRRSRQRALPL